MMNRLESPPAPKNDESDNEFVLGDDIVEEEEREAQVWEEETKGMEESGNALWGELAEWRREHPPLVVLNRQHDVKTARPEGTKVDKKKKIDENDNEEDVLLSGLKNDSN